MEDEVLNPVNAEQEDVVDSQEDLENETEINDNTDESGKNSDVAEPEDELSETKQTKEENAIYAKLRRKAEEELKTKYSPVEQSIREIESLTGMNVNQVTEYLRNQKIEQEAQTKADLLGVTPKIAKEMIQQKMMLEDLQRRDLSREQERINLQQKTELKDKPFFKELEDDINTMVANVPGVDVKTAYYYVRGEKMEELLGKEKSNTTKRVVADMQDRAKYKNSAINNDAPSGDSETLSREAMEMALAFGNDPKKISKYVKENLKRR